jgi:DNA-binding CsgD family transcriptional regulator
MRRAGKTAEQLARIAGRSIGWVQQHLNLLKLEPDVRAMMIPRR